METAPAAQRPPREARGEPEGSGRRTRSNPFPLALACGGKRGERERGPEVGFPFVRRLQKAGDDGGSTSRALLTNSGERPPSRPSPLSFSSI